MKTYLRLKKIHVDKVVYITIISTILLILEKYHSFFSWKPLDRTFLYLVIPLVLIIFVFRETPATYGFRLGDWKTGLLLTAGSLVLALPVLWLVVRGNESMRIYYQGLINPSLPVYTFFDLIGWEFLFRGWLTFAYVEKYGSDGLWLQAVPFALAHISKPEIETLSTIFGGYVFGWIAWKSNSFLYPFLIHWSIFTFVVLFSY